VTGDTVMTERTDVFKIGPFHMRFWVFGTFRVENGRIVLLRDYFDWLNIGRGLLTGLAGIPFRSVRERPLTTP
jgi:limonene-1,2-epoxide hydrolase